MNDLQDNQGQGVLYVSGTRGYSAYEIAVQNGFVGTEEEWLDSLVGPQGEPGTPFDELTEEQKAEIRGEEGKSAYDIAVENGYEGTEQDWVNSFLNPYNYVQKSEVVDNLESTSSEKPLSANKGRELKEDIDEQVEYIFPKFWSNAYSGDANLIKYKNKVIMIDCYHYNQWNDVLEMLNDNEISHIDYFILTHFHIDHYGNFKNLVNNNFIDSTTVIYFPIETSLFQSIESVYNEYKTFCSEHNLNYHVPNEYETLTIENITLTFFNCDKETMEDYYYNDSTYKNYNNFSLVFTLRHRNVLSFYAGDCLKLAYQRFREEKFIPGKLDMFKIGHHGIETQTDVQFIKNIHPIFAIQPTGILDYVKNNFGVCQETSMMREMGTMIYPVHNQDDYLIFASNGYSIKCKQGSPQTISRQTLDYNLYVDINASKSDIQDGSIEHPFSELMQAINLVEMKGTTDVNIYLADGTYGVSHEDNQEKNSIFIRTGKNGRIRIVGNTEDRTKVILNRVRIQESNVTLEHLTVDIDNATTAGIYCITDCSLYLTDVLIDSLTNTLSTELDGIRISNNSQFSSVNTRINNVNNGIRANDSIAYIHSLDVGTINNEVLIMNRSIYHTATLSFDNESDRIKLKAYRLMYWSPALLFTGSENASITLKEELSNYDWFEIQYTNDSGNINTTGRLYKKDNPQTIFLTSSIIDSDGTVHNQYARVYINGKNITIDRNRQMNISTSGTVTITQTGNYLSVVKVIAGYREYIYKY